MPFATTLPRPHPDVARSGGARRHAEAAPSFRSRRREVRPPRPRDRSPSDARVGPVREAMPGGRRREWWSVAPGERPPRRPRLDEQAPTWVRRMFPAIQAAWGSGDIRRLDPYVSATLGDHLRHELAAFERDGVRPRVEHPRLQEVTVLSAGTEDRPILEVLFTARDWLADLRTGAVVGGDAERLR